MARIALSAASSSSSSTVTTSTSLRAPGPWTIQASPTPTRCRSPAPATAGTAAASAASSLPTRASQASWKPALSARSYVARTPPGSSWLSVTRNIMPSTGESAATAPGTIGLCCPAPARNHATRQFGNLRARVTRKRELSDFDNGSRTSAPGWRCGLVGPTGGWSPRPCALDGAGGHVRSDGCGCHHREPAPRQSRSALVADRLRGGQRGPRRCRPPGGPRLPQLARAAGDPSLRRSGHHGRDLHPHGPVVMPHVLRDADIRAVPETAELRQVKRDPTASFSGNGWNEPRPARPGSRARCRP